MAAISSAWSRRWPPSSREMKLPEPWPKKKPTAWMMAMREKATPMAPVALLLCILPTKKVSARL